MTNDQLLLIRYALSRCIEGTTADAEMISELTKLRDDLYTLSAHNDADEYLHRVNELFSGPLQDVQTNTATEPS